MIKMFPTSPGLTKQWTVEIDFEANGFPKYSEIFESWIEAVAFVRHWLGEEVKF